MPINLASFVEYEIGNRQNKHVFMRMQMSNGDIEEVDMYIDDKGKKYRTRLDSDIKSASPRKRISKKEKLRREIIQTFEQLLCMSTLNIA